MKDFLKYFITQVWAIIGLALCMYVFCYPIAEDRQLPLSTQIICICVAIACLIIYRQMIKRLDKKEK